MTAVVWQQRCFVIVLEQRRDLNVSSRARALGPSCQNVGCWIVVDNLKVHDLPVCTRWLLFVAAAVSANCQLLHVDPLRNRNDFGHTYDPTTRLPLSATCNLPNAIPSCCLCKSSPLQSLTRSLLDYLRYSVANFSRWQQLKKQN